MTIKLTGPFARNTAVAEFDVRQIKKVLNQLGYYTPDEEFGITGFAETKLFDALKEFQKDHSLNPTGSAKPDDETIRLLNQEADKDQEGYYIWRTVEDGKVRAAHAQYNRTVRKWSDAPDPGDDYNCRCWAEHVERTVEGIYDPPIEPVYPEMFLIPLLRTGRIASVASKLFKFAKQEERWNVEFNRKQLQKKFKHAKFFKIKGNPNSSTLEEFRKSIQEHVDSPDTIIKQGTYRKKNVTHYFNKTTKINVIRDSSGQFHSVWKPSDDQILHMLKDGKLGGGR